MVAILILDEGFSSGVKTHWTGQLGKKKRLRKRRSVKDVFELLGLYYSKRVFWMTLPSFTKLCDLVKPHMVERRLHKARVNGFIKHNVKNSCTLRPFAGSSVYNLTVTFENAVSKLYGPV